MSQTTLGPDVGLSAHASSLSEKPDCAATADQPEYRIETDQEDDRKDEVDCAKPTDTADQNDAVEKRIEVADGAISRMIEAEKCSARKRTENSNADQHACHLS